MEDPLPEDERLKMRKEMRERMRSEVRKKPLRSTEIFPAGSEFYQMIAEMKEFEQKQEELTQTLLHEIRKQNRILEEIRDALRGPKQ